ncbi:hypothetical protein CHS0354_002418 [Potamilus streckersoni]|uniref:RING-type domain-containing protein n=1 Tax=Potamilus streckersoni TaxID=2493646 RepID=A0AAE0T8V7_9BIVA|nr:hypothetical protein CHS0354_002418 [Potamilus streckersoni]
MAEQTGGGSGAKPRYCTVADRLQTFGNWPSSNHQQPRDLTEAGFFYEGDGDRVTCYSCGEVLSSWTPEDDPWAEHEKFQPRCEHVLQHRMGGMNLGSSDVDEVAQGHSVEASGDDSKGMSQHSKNDPKKEERNTSRQRAHETVEEELQRLRHQFACKTCFKEKACMVILPCCHLSACAICVEKLHDCNVCHQRITATVKAYCA